MFEGNSGVFASFQQPLDFASKNCVVATRGGEECTALFWLTIQSRLEETLYP